MMGSNVNQNKNKNLTVTHSRIAPLPTPDELSRYNTVLPGAAERIVVQMEKQSSHRQEIERIAVLTNTNRITFGLYFAFAFGVMTLGASVYLIASGHDYSGVALFGTTLIAVVKDLIHPSKNKD